MKFQSNHRQVQYALATTEAVFLIMVTKEQIEAKGTMCDFAAFIEGQGYKVLACELAELGKEGAVDFRYTEKNAIEEP